MTGTQADAHATATTTAPHAPLVAVCGLAPRAGTTVLSGLLTQALAARDSAATVVDCGLLTAPGADALASATHIVWTVPAGPQAATVVSALLLDGDVAPPPGQALELLAVVATTPSDETHDDQQRALLRVAAARCERVVLVPHVRALAGRQADAARVARADLADAVDAIAGALRQPPPP